MTNTNIYQNITARTGGDIYLGVVGPVRTGKSTFIKRFMDVMVLPRWRILRQKSGLWMNCLSRLREKRS